MNFNEKNKKRIKRGFYLLTIALICLSFTGAVQASEHYDRNREDKFYGVIEKLPGNGYIGVWIIGGQTVVVSDDTRIKEKYGRAAAGEYVKVEGVQVENSFIAYKLEVEESGKYRPDSRISSSKFYGTVEGLPRTGLEGIWLVKGREVLVTRNTRLKEKYGRAEVGSYVEVEGNYSGNIFTVYEIEVKNSRR